MGFWNVRTLIETSRLRQVTREMVNYGLDILGLSEVRWLEAGEMQTQEGLTFLYSGPTGDGAEHRNGVGLLLNKGAKQSLMQWIPVSERLLTARFKTNIRNVTIIQCYAPTEASDEELKEEFYSSLRDTVYEISKRDIIIIMGDLNAKVGNDNEGLEHVMGIHGLGERNENGEMFTNFCASHDLVIGGTVFPHKNCHKVTWVSNDHKTENQIDHIAVSRKFRRSLMNVRNKRGADIKSDHHLVVAEFRLKIMATQKKFEQRNRQYDVRRLKVKEKKTEFCLELKNRFTALQEVQENEVPDESVEEEWTKIKDLYNSVSESVLGFKDRQKKDWMTEDTWELIGRRKKMKARLNASKTRQQKAQTQIEYEAIDKLVKRSARRDKRMWVDEQALRAEKAAERGGRKRIIQHNKDVVKERV